MIDSSTWSSNLLSRLRPRDLLSKNNEVDDNGNILTPAVVNIYLIKLKEKIDKFLRTCLNSSLELYPELKDSHKL